MARITLSIADDVAAQLDAYAAESHLNRSQAAELVFRKFFAGDEASPSGTGDDALALAQQLAEIKDFLTLFHGALVGFTDQLPELPWAENQVVSFIGRRPPRKAKSQK